MRDIGRRRGACGGSLGTENCLCRASKGKKARVRRQRGSLASVPIRCWRRHREQGRGGLLIVDAETGETLYELNADK